MYDLLLDGKDNFQADRAAAAQVLRLVPAVQAAAFANRRFLRSAVRYLAETAGIDQFLDLGVGRWAVNVHIHAGHAAAGRTAAGRAARRAVIRHRDTVTVRSRNRSLNKPH